MEQLGQYNNFKVIRRLLLVCLSILLIYSVALRGQNTSWEFNNLTSKMGLSHSDVTCFCQDHEGYMWIGTANGLNRYNGADIHVYKKTIDDSTSLPGYYINLIFEDLENNLWIDAGGTLVRYNKDLDNFEKFVASGLDSYPYRTNAILDLDTNTLLLATNNGCHTLNKKDNTIHPYTNKYFIANQNLDFNIITSDPKGNIWFSVIDMKSSNSGQGKGGLYKLDPSSKIITHFNTEHPEIKLKENHVNSLLINNDNEIWLGYQSKGVDVFKEGAGRIASYMNNPNNKKSLSSNTITSIKEDRYGNILIGTGGGGLNLLDRISNSFGIYYNTVSERSLITNTVNDIYIGKDGMIWIGCLNGGVSIYDERFDKFILYNSDKLGENKELLSNITCFTEDLNSNIWIASDGSGIHSFNPVKRTFNHFNGYLQSNKVLAVIADADNGLWAGTWGEGLLYFKIQDEQLKLIKRHTSVDKSIPNSNNIFTLYIDKKGTLWVGTFGRGLWFYNKKQQLFEHVEIDKLLPNSNNWMTIRSIIEDSEGYLWIATEINGLFRYDRETKESIAFQHIDTVSTSIRSNYLNFVFEDSKNRIWVGYNDYGLGLYNRKENVFYNYNMQHGLPDNTVVGILEDEDGKFWLSTYNGLSRVVIDSINNPESFKCTNYFLSDGLQDKIFNRWSYFHSKSGQMYFGGPSGFNTFYPSNLRENDTPPPIYLTDFQINRQSVSFKLPGSPLKKHISQTKEIILEHNQSDITFKFIAINFIHNDQNQYAYYLEGFDAEEWIHVSNSREAIYTNTPSGKYTFRVKASNNDDVWNEAGASVSITILPPWWQTIWFRILVVLIFIGMLIAFYYYRITSLKKQKKHLENQVFKRTSDLSEANTLLEERQQNIEEQAEELEVQKEYLLRTNDELSLSNATKDKFFSIIAHDLKNPFSSVLGFSELLSRKAETMERKKMTHLLQILHSSAKGVYLLLENLLQWSRAQTGKIDVQKEEINLSIIVKDNIQLIRNMADKKGLKIISTVPENMIVFADSNLINTSIRNLLTNSIKFTEKGCVTISTKSTELSIELLIKDSGVGIPSEKLKDLFSIDKNTSTQGTQGESGTGLGLLICKEFIELNNGELKVESEVDKGSVFIIKLPKPSPDMSK